VDASLKDKLKCLIFIPIISRTYCDPKSFAWEHEFKAFVEQASQDQFGLKVKLPNGNVTNRVLPIIIHDLDRADIKQCESVLDGVMRGVEFIYKEPGVNRSLNTCDDVKTNLNKTSYRNQINKVALAIREVMSGLTKGSSEIISDSKSPIEDKTPVKEKSIIVLPFENISPDPDQEYFSDGLTEEIITDLSHIHDLLVISRSSAMTFKGTKKTIPEIAQAVKVRYVLEGSVRKAGNNLRITAQLIDSITDAHLWAEKYSGSLDDVFDIQEKVSRSIVDSLNIKLNPKEDREIVERPIDNIQAYGCYLKALREIYVYSPESLKLAYQEVTHALEIVGENALLYATMGLILVHYFNCGVSTDLETLNKAEEFAEKAYQLKPEASYYYNLLGMIARHRGKALEAIKYLNEANKRDPNNPDVMAWLGYLLGVFAAQNK